MVPSVCQLQDQIIALRRAGLNVPEGYVTVKQGHVTKTFTATEDTDSSRMGALRLALEYAELTPATPAIVELSQGRFAIPSGLPLSTYASNATIEFQQGAAVIYANPVNAKLDSGFYYGPRNVLNFGAVPSDDFTGDISTSTDCLSALKAAHNSLPVAAGYLGMGYGETPPSAPAKGTGTLYTTTAAGFPLGATLIPLITGSGTVLAGDVVTFAGDTTHRYTVTAGVSAPGTITITPGLLQAIPTSATAMTIRDVGSDLHLGRIYFPAVTPEGDTTVYYISDSWEISAFANLEGENRKVYISFRDNVATVSEKFVVYMLANVSQGPGAANTFNASLNNLCIRGHREHNAFSSGLRFSCAQGGTIPWLEISECGLRGFVTDINGGSIDVGYLNVSHITRGPGISLYTCYSFVAAQVVCSFINRYLWAKDGDGDYYSALFADSCKGIWIDAFQAEDAPTGAKFKNCNGIYVPILSTSKYLRTVTGASNTNPIVITDVGSNRNTGDKVTIRGVFGNTNANVEDWPITRINNNTFSLDARNGTGTYTSGGQYLPGLNAGVIVDGSDNYEFGLDVNLTTYAFVDRTLGTTLTGSFLGDVKGRYSRYPVLDPLISFVGAGTIESRTSTLKMRPNNTDTATFSSASLVLSTLVNPAVTNTLDLGSSGVIWRSLYAAQLRVDRTDTATVGNVTINKAAGSVKFAALATSLVITNSLVTTASRVIATVNTVDATMKSVVAVCTSLPGAITLTPNAIPTGETNVSFLVLNP